MEIEFMSYSAHSEEHVLKMLREDTESGNLFLRLLDDLRDNCRVVFADGSPAGILLTEQSGLNIYIWLFIAREMRRRGIGTKVLQQAEAELSENVKKITSFFNKADRAALGFAEKHGFARTFDSEYMEYTGGMFPEEKISVRPYMDVDYLEAQKMYAEAFHRMRVQVGDFPDSIVYPPSEKNRQFWREDAENYFLYEQNGEIVGVGHLNGREIGSISVRIDKQGRGIGTKFVPYLVNRILERGYEKVNLECVVGNPARKLYDRLGFRALYTERFVEKKLGGDKK